MSGKSDRGLATSGKGGAPVDLQKHQQKQKGDQTRRKREKKVIEMKDKDTQTELKGVVYSSADVSLLNLEMCKVQNECSDFVKKIDSLTKQLEKKNECIDTLNEKYEKQSEQLFKQSDLSTDILNKNKSLQEQNEKLLKKADYCNEYVCSLEDKKNEIAELKSKLSKYEEVMKENCRLKENIDVLLEENRIKKKTIDELTEILSKCPDKPKDLRQKLDSCGLRKTNGYERNSNHKPSPSNSQWDQDNRKREAEDSDDDHTYYYKRKSNFDSSHQSSAKDSSSRNFQHRNAKPAFGKNKFRGRGAFRNNSGTNKKFE